MHPNLHLIGSRSDEQGAIPVRFLLLLYSSHGKITERPSFEELKWEEQKKSLNSTEVHSGMVDLGAHTSCNWSDSLADKDETEALEASAPDV